MPGHGRKFQGPMMQLHHPICHGKANAAATFFGGEIQVKNFIADVSRNPRPLVADGQYNGVWLAFQ